MVFLVEILGIRLSISASHFIWAVTSRSFEQISKCRWGGRAGKSKS